TGDGYASGRQARSVPAWIVPSAATGSDVLAGRTSVLRPWGLDEYFSTGPAHERPVIDAVMRHRRQSARRARLGWDLAQEDSELAELRPRQRWVALSFSLPRRPTRPSCGGWLRMAAAIFTLPTWPIPAKSTTASAISSRRPTKI